MRLNRRVVSSSNRTGINMEGLESRQMLRAMERMGFDESQFHSVACGCGCRTWIPKDLSALTGEFKGTVPTSAADAAENTSRFNITLDLEGMTPAQEQIFRDAAAQWESVLLGDLPSQAGIDDVLISASLTPIDGPGGVLGQASPTNARTSGPFIYIPYAGFMEFDTGDVNGWNANYFKSIVLHEMGHVLGIGTIWSLKNLVSGSGGSDPRFNGANALAEYRKLRTPAAASVPVENTGGGGTYGSHWRESDLDSELMTGYAESQVAAMPLSRITAGSMIDLGYPNVNLDAADLYQAPGGNALPTLTGLTDSPDPSSGPTITLTALGVFDSVGVQSVSFWRESNVFSGLQSGGPSPDTLLGTLTSPVNGSWTLNIDASALANGQYTFYARVLDSQGAASAIQSVTHTRLAGGTPPAVPSVPLLAAQSDSGISNSDRITNIVLPTFTGTGEAGSIVLLRINNTNVGQGVVGPDGTWSVTLETPLGEGTYSVSAAAQGLTGVSDASEASSLTIDVTAPTVSAQPLEFLTALRVNFDHTEPVFNVGSSNFTLVQTPSQTPVAFSYAGQVGNRSVLDLNPALVPDGRFTATIANAGIIDVAGNALANSASLSFFFLRGDANRSANVNFADLLSLSQNYGRTDANWSMGDFNYDGVVGFIDLLLLSQRFNSSVITTESVAASRTAKFSRTTIRQDVLA